MNYVEELESTHMQASNRPITVRGIIKTPCEWGWPKKVVCAPGCERAHQVHSTEYVVWVYKPGQ